MLPKKRYLAVLGLILAVTGAVYANHFDNEFHFDDSHAVQSNPHITTLTNAVKFFTDGSMFSALPLNQSYRPLLTLSLAFDYWWAPGLKPYAFHVTSFTFFFLQLVAMFFLFRRVLPEGRDWVALFGVGLYALHPVSAETVNYVIQRGDIMSTFGVVLAFALYLHNPKPWGWHLVAMLGGCFSKQPAVMYAPILFAYVYLFYTPQKKQKKKKGSGESSFGERLGEAVRQTWPAFVVAGAFFVLQKAMTPKMATTGGSSLFWYILTQPWITLHYVRSFFWPNELTADTDWGLLNAGSPELYVGVAFLLVLVGFLVAAIRSSEWRVEAFGLSWFVLALLPTALLPLAEVMNDHRMYFPYVGFTLTVIALAYRALRQIPQPRVQIAVAAALTLVIYSGSAYATYQRNEVWHSENTLWYDVTQKSPRNGRGLMNYGLTLMQKADYMGALGYFERAHVLLPHYTYVETNLGIVKAALRREEEAERHFKRAMTLSPVPVAHAYYARFLRERGRLEESRQVLELGLRMQPDQWDIRFALLSVLAEMRQYDKLRGALAEAKKYFPYRRELERFNQVLARPEAQ